MKTESCLRKIYLGLAFATVAACGSQLMADPIDYATVSGSAIDFNAGTVSFSSTGTPAASFQITDGSAQGDLGLMSGSFSIGTITTSAGVSTAPVTGTGSLTIYDGVSDSTDLTATLTWGSIVQVGAIGGLNSAATIDLTNIDYAGTNADLLALMNSGSGANVLTFQFGSAVPLSTLATTTTSTSYSGSIYATVPDDGTTALLIGMGLAGISVGLLVRRRQAAAA